MLDDELEQDLTRQALWERVMECDLPSEDVAECGAVELVGECSAVEPAGEAFPL